MSTDLQPLFPDDGAEINELTVTLRWEAAEGADNYQIQIARDPDFDDIVFEGRVGDTTEFSVSGLPPQEGVRLYWHVRPAVDGDWEAFGPVASFLLVDWTPEQPPLESAEAPEDDPEADVRPATEATQSLGAPALLATMVVIAFAGVAALYILVGGGGADPDPAATASTPAPDTSNADLREYRLVDEETGVYRIPIDSAMKDVVQSRGGSWR
jgi:hypothetical protein